MVVSCSCWKLRLPNCKSRISTRVATRGTDSLGWVSCRCCSIRLESLPLGRLTVSCDNDSGTSVCTDVLTTTTGLSLAGFWLLSPSCRLSPRFSLPSAGPAIVLAMVQSSVVTVQKSSCDVDRASELTSSEGPLPPWAISNEFCLDLSSVSDDCGTSSFGMPLAAWSAIPVSELDCSECTGGGSAASCRLCALDEFDRLSPVAAAAAGSG